MPISRRLPPALAWRIYFWFALDRKRVEIVNVPARFGSAELSSDGTDLLEHHHAFHGCAEWPGLMIARLLLAKGACVFELGANLGTETLNLAAIVGGTGSVVAIEPNSECYRRLAARVAANELQQVRVIRVAIDQSEGLVALCDGPEINSGMSHVVERQSQMADMWVHSTTLDLLARTHGAPAFVWMDIEGSELNALRGAKVLLLTHRPTVFCEINRNHLERAGGSVEELVALMRNLRYTFFNASDWRLRPVDTGSIPSGAYHANWLMMPRERAEVVRRIRPLFIAWRFLPWF
jgi:FkbM family methyltransferase